MNRLDAFNARMTARMMRAVSTPAGLFALAVTGGILLATSMFGVRP